MEHELEIIIYEYFEMHCTQYKPLSLLGAIVNNSFLCLHCVRVQCTCGNERAQLHEILIGAHTREKSE